VEDLGEWWGSGDTILTNDKDFLFKNLSTDMFSEHLLLGNGERKHIVQKASCIFWGSTFGALGLPHGGLPNLVHLFPGVHKPLPTNNIPSQQTTKTKQQVFNEKRLPLVGGFNPSEKYKSIWIYLDHFPR